MLSSDYAEGVIQKDKNVTISISPLWIWNKNLLVCLNHFFPRFLTELLAAFSRINWKSKNVEMIETEMYPEPVKTHNPYFVNILRYHLKNAFTDLHLRSNAFR